jgi:hypothetical protein
MYEGVIESEGPAGAGRPAITSGPDQWEKVVEIWQGTQNRVVW